MHPALWIRAATLVVCALASESAIAQYGMPPMDAIKAATVNAADLLGMTRDAGTVEPGKSADIIAVSGNPLNDVTLLKHVSFVMKSGEVYVTKNSGSTL